MDRIEHYENFPVASWLCPPGLRSPIRAIYNFARTADDLADEGNAGPELRITDLAEFEADFLKSLALPTNESVDIEPVASKRWSWLFPPLSQQIQAFGLPVQPFCDLLSAFRQDVEYSRDERRYQSFEELMGYCQRSANPIGRLLLHLTHVTDEHSKLLSDHICTALQLINFWQDLSIDLPRKRFYLPENSDLIFELKRARALMLLGAPLCERMPGRMAWELRAVVQGGLLILEKCQQTNTRLSRPVLSWKDFPSLLWGVLKMPQLGP